MSRAIRALVPVMALAVLAGCGSSSKTGGGVTPTAAGNRSTMHGVSIPVPAGWSVEQLMLPTGFAIAAHRSDLDADAPAGPRLVARRGVGQPAQPATLFKDLDPAPFIGDVNTVNGAVDGHLSTGIEATQAVGNVNETTRVIVVTLDDEMSYTFTLEAPRAQWQTDLPTFETVIRGATIDLAAVRSAG